MLLLLVFGSLAIATFLAVELLTAEGRARQTSVRRAATYGRVERRTTPSREDLRERVGPWKEGLARWVLRLTPKLSVEAVSAKLLAAGLVRRLSPTGFLALKGALGIGSLLLGIMMRNGLLLMLGMSLAAFFAPDAYVTMKARGRKEQVGVELPDALDILAVSVEAGLGFDASVSKIVDHMEGPLAEEFALTLGEMRVGRSRQEALKNLADRLDTPEMGAFTRAVIQADQLGMSLGKILRVQAEDTRNRRQAAAEEKAMKAPVKMIFPTAVFILPAIFLVILGPAFLNLLELF